MKFCEHCGCQMPDDSVFCPECGAKSAAAVSPAAAPAVPPAPVPQYVQPSEDFRPPVQQPVQQDTGAEGHKFKAVLSYFGILVLIPILLDKDSAFTRFHANQGLVLFIVSIVLYVLSSVCAALGLALVGLVLIPLNLAIFVFSIMGIVNAAGGKMKKLPLLGQITLLK